MEELEISGKRYISTRRAARQHGYHSDYMGQLIRSGKVAGQKVGRAWYIEEESLAVYLGKAPAPVAAPVKVAPAPVLQAPEPVVGKVIEEEVVAEEVASVVPEQMIVNKEAEKVEEVVQEIPQAEQELIKEEPQEVASVPPAEEESFAEEKSTRIPIHIPAAAIQEISGLRYVADDSPSLPAITRMPQAPAYAEPVRLASSIGYEAPHKSRFPYISLSIVGVLAIAAAAFTSNFVSATIVSEPGKTATVEYAIHW